MTHGHHQNNIIMFTGQCAIHDSRKKSNLQKKLISHRCHLEDQFHPSLPSPLIAAPSQSPSLLLSGSLSLATLSASSPASCSSLKDECKVFSRNCTVSAAVLHYWKDVFTISTGISAQAFTIQCATVSLLCRHFPVRVSSCSSLSSQSITPQLPDTAL